MINFTFDLQRFDSAFSGGDGSENNPYKISTAADLEQLARDVNGGNGYDGKYFKVTNDIKLSNHTWQAIGNDFDRIFKGHFDGDGHFIDNMTAMHENHNAADGLFGYTGGGATIKNVNLTGVRIRSDYYDIGAIVANVHDTEISNCTVQGTVEVGGIGVYAGGIVGQLWSGSMKNCAFLGTFRVIDSGVLGTGAIAGFSMSWLGGNYYYGDYDNYDNRGATRIYNFNVPKDVTFDESVTILGKDYIKAGDVTFKYMGTTYKYNVKSDVTVTIKDNKLFANDTDLGAVFPATLTGDGSENKPYLIKTEADLRQLATYVNYGNNCAGLNFKLANDIKLTENFTPIGTASKPFSGNFDGNGKTVSGLTINNRKDDQGFFGTVENATIKNVRLTDVNVAAASFVGSLVGTVTDNSQILNCSAQGNVESSDKLAYAGGLVGRINSYKSGGSNSVIDSCAFFGTVKTKAPNELYRSHGGGIIGINDGTVKNSIFVGGSFDCANAGAIVGRNGSGKLIDNYYYGTLPDGVNPDRATQVFKINVINSVTSPSIVTVNGIKLVKAGDVAFTYNGKTYNYTVTEDLAVLVQEDNLYFGKIEMSENFLSTLDGKGTENNPYLIQTEKQFNQLANYVSYGNDCAGKNFKLANDIALTNNFIPVGDNLTPFKGNFDGDGKTISNLTIDGNDNQGLFGKVDGSTIKNFNLTNVDVTGKDNVGAVVGFADNNAQILNCSAQGNVKGSANVGGLVGVNNDSTVKDGACLGGTITGASSGAIVGNNTGTLTGNNYYYGTLADGVSNNDAAQIFKADLPEGVTSTALVEFNGTTYIKAGSVSLSYGHKIYSHNVTGDITVKIDGNKFFVNNTEYTSNFPGYLDGNGTENNPFLIKSEEDLRELATYVNGGGNCAGMNFKLDNDIALTGEWTPVGIDNKNKFSGTFDGDGKIISNLTINGDAENKGLFGCVENATIKNVNLPNVNLSGSYRVSALVATVYDNSQILNCSASGNIKSNGLCSYGGGLVAQINDGGIIDGCTFSGNIEGTKVPDEMFILGSHVGGIVGVCSGGTVKNCAYLGGTIKSSDGGAITSKKLPIKNFSNNYYYGKLDEDIGDNGATQIFKADLPEGVTSTSIVEINGTKYIKAGEVTLTYNGENYSRNISADLTVTLQDDKLSFGEQATAMQGIQLHASDKGDTLTGGTGNDSLWGGAGKDTFIHNGGHDIIYGFGKGDSLKVNGIDDITATYNTADNDIKIPCGTGSVTLKDFTTNEFPINSNTWTLSGNTLTKK